jgi:AcrR family transcriptional regulator
MMKRDGNRWQEILDTAAELFATRGYDRTTMADIGDAVGLGKGGLYHYVTTKDDLLADLQESILAPLVTVSQVVVSLPISATARLRLLSEILLTVQFDHLHQSRLLLAELRRLEGERQERFLARRAAYDALFQQVITDGVAAGEFRQTDVSVARLTFIGMHSYTSVWLDPSGPMDARQLSAFFCDVFVDGLGVPGAPRDAAKVEEEMDHHREELQTLLAVASERYGLRLGPRPPRSARRKRGPSTAARR